ncbi:MAG: glycosyltransferase [Candidatus Sericytochromatia bacterium]|nr:glycosyltransferase [Candidatus Sericytochromatia bacterium]
MSAISILVPTYNRAAYLKDCLDSLLATTVPCEILVADNASTDETEALMATYTDARIRYVRHATNLGPFGNYNFLLAAATRDYVCLFGDDDIALPGCFEKKLALLESHPEVTGVYSLAQVMDADGTLSNGSKVQGVPDVPYVSGRDDFLHLLINCCISWQTLVFRRELVVRHGLIPSVPEGLLARDWDYLIGLSRHGQFAFLNEPTVGIRMHDDSTTVKEATTAGRMVEDMLTIWHKWLVEADDPPVITMATWEAIGNALLGGVQACYGANRLVAQTVLGQLETLKAAYLHRMDRQFYGRLHTWLPGIADQDAEGLPVFKPGLAPLTLDSPGMRFLHHPDWDGDVWIEVLRRYTAAFTAGDKVELVLWLDPVQGVTAAEAGDRIEAAFQTLGVDPAQAADVQLFTEALDLAGVAALYAAVHVIVPGGDQRQLARGVQSGRVVMTHLEPEVWRALAKKYTASPVA